MDKKVVFNVSTSIFSIARHSGGAKIQGKMFIYDPINDALIRNDLMKTYKKCGSFEKFIEHLKIYKNNAKY